MKTEQPLLTTTVVAVVQLKARRFVATSGAVPGVGAKVLGVANADYDAGETAGVGVLGIFIVETGGAVGVDDDVQSDVMGRATTKGAGAACGRALDVAPAAGSFIRVARGI